MTNSNPPHSSSREYAVLVILLVLGLASFLSFSHQPTAQLWIVLIIAVGYVLWGIWHHQRQGNLYWQVVVEYVLIAGLMIALSVSLLWA